MKTYYCSEVSTILDVLMDDVIKVFWLMTESVPALGGRITEPTFKAWDILCVGLCLELLGLGLPAPTVQTMMLTIWEPDRVGDMNRLIKNTSKINITFILGIDGTWFRSFTCYDIRSPLKSERLIFVFNFHMRVKHILEKMKMFDNKS